ncbi:hypothetical protein [[Mycobacterium] burgundiense]|uniref:PE family protein n=1 Tax=[Mycobacterium] burgundiense TaxID=3064286 RepID=A0ABM9LVT9_9MYCO|nr:hypothetical protein [Mycolicibacterium sp. MU0053]CAJ1505560.1 hypothetical protein MU0053_002966 [Mycolicibacterium sp. MU0053]
MDEIALSNPGLQHAAVQHTVLAQETAAGIPVGGTVSGQASSAAVSAANAAVTAAATALAAWLSTTGVKVRTVGAVMTEQDHASARLVAAVHPTARM